MTNKEQNNLFLVKQAIDTLNTGNTSRVSEFISPRYFNHESQMDPVRSKMRGPQEFIDTVSKLREAFSDLHYEQQNSISSEEMVLSIVTVTAKHTGSFFGFIPATGNKIKYEATHIFTIGEDDKITEHRAIRDDLALMFQLGLVKAASLQYNEFLQTWKGGS
jgi:predicted ester cyclase